MNRFITAILLTCLLLLSVPSGAWAATVHYVDLNNTNTTSPFTDWSTAARNIQDAVDAAVDGDLILVTNGVYQTGVQKLYGSSNRLAVTKQLLVQSVNGPDATVISGNGTVRCVFLTNNATLIGFTLTNGMAGDGGALWCPSATAIASNCVLSGNSAISTGGAASGGTLQNCIITNNSAGPGTYGGGVYQSTAIDCIIAYNSANVGGGAYQANLTNCTITKNSAVNLGGGTASCTARGCTISSNSAPTGGGTYFGTFYYCTFNNNDSPSGGMGGGAHAALLNNCLITGNTASLGAGTSFGTAIGCTIVSNRVNGLGGLGGGSYQSTLLNCSINGNSTGNGGGAYNSSLNNCIISSNTASANGGGSSGGTLNNCVVIGNVAQNGGGCYGPGGLNNSTVVGNSASGSGGGVNGSGTMNNCIVFFNNSSSGSNYSGVKMNFCCTTPVLTGDTTSFTNAPSLVNMLMGDVHLQSNSPCINAGKNAYATNSVDMDGNPRIVDGTVDIGAYEYQSPSSILSYAWAQRFGLSTDGSADFTDQDNDGMNNWQEWRAGTNPTNATSVLLLYKPTLTAGRVTLTWTSVTNRSYFVLRASDLGAATSFMLVQTNLPGLPNTTSYTDTNAPATGSAFYRVGVQ